MGKKDDAADVQRIRLKMGFRDDHKDENLDALIRQCLREYDYYTDVIAAVRRRLGIDR